jgi:anti-sigma factor RsiW
MNDPTDKLDEEVRQKLVAYLDGELDQESAREVEAQMSRSSTVRHEMDTLKKAWELLDYLPKPQAPQNFSQRTMERLSAVKLSTVKRQRQMQWLSRIGWAAGLAFVGLFSGWVTYRATPAVTPSTDELQVLEYRNYWNSMLQTESMEFLRQLDQPDLFGEDS